MPNEEKNKETAASLLVKDAAGYVAGKAVSLINPVAGNVLNIGLAIYNHREGIAELHNANVKYEADNYRKYGNDPHLNFDTTAPLAGHYNNTNIGQNISNTVSSFNNAFGKAVLDDASRSFGTSSHSDFMNNFNNSSNDFIGKTSFGSSSGGFDFGSKF